MRLWKTTENLGHCIQYPGRVWNRVLEDFIVCSINAIYTRLLLTILYCVNYEQHGINIAVLKVGSSRKTITLPLDYEVCDFLILLVM